MNLRNSLQLILLAAIWGASFLFMRMAVDDLGAIAMIQLRVGIGAACLLPILLLNFKSKMDIRKIAHSSLVGITNSVLPFSLLAYATLYVSAGYTSLLNSSVPLWSAIIAAVWLKDWLTRWQLLGIFIGFSGMCVLVLEQGNLTLTGPTMAILASTIATISYGFSANYTKRFLSDIPPLYIASISLFSGSLALLPLSITYWPNHPIKTETWVVVTALGVICTALAFIIYFDLIKRVGPTKTVSVTFLIPIFAVFWGFLFLDEEVTIYMIVGCLIIFVGTSLTLGLLKPTTTNIVNNPNTN